MIMTYDIIADFTTWRYCCAATSWFWNRSVTRVECTSNYLSANIKQFKHYNINTFCWFVYCICICTCTMCAKCLATIILSPTGTLVMKSDNQRRYRNIVTDLHTISRYKKIRQFKPYTGLQWTDASNCLIRGFQGVPAIRNNNYNDNNYGTITWEWMYTTRLCKTRRKKLS